MSFAASLNLSWRFSLSLVPSFLRQRKVQTSQTPQVPWTGQDGYGGGRAVGGKTRAS